MNQVMVHRGPDEGATACHGPIGLAARRLNIMDPKGGSQPIYSEDKSKVMVCNGEIYNFRELQRSLNQKGHYLSTACDTEVVLHAYEEYGEACFEYLRGMFAVALWDEHQQHLLLGRDRFGIKPLYYYWDGELFLFASELKAMLLNPKVKRTIDPYALDDYFTFHYIPSPKTIFQHMRKVEPGQSVRISCHGIQTRSYWELRFDQEPLSSKIAYSDGVREKLDEAIRIHLQSEVPTGAFLSSGMDSSTIVGMMSKHQKEAVFTASLGFEEAPYNEIPLIQDMKSEFNLASVEAVLGSEAIEAFQRIVWHYDEPFADSSMLPTYYVSALARTQASVCLSGDGGDENFAGYPRFVEYMKSVEDPTRCAKRDYYEGRTYLRDELRNRLYLGHLKKSLGTYDPYSPNRRSL